MGKERVTIFISKLFLELEKCVDVLFVTAKEWMLKDLFDNHVSNDAANECTSLLITGKDVVPSFLVGPSLACYNFQDARRRHVWVGIYACEGVGLVSTPD